MAHFESAHDSLRELALFAGAGGGILGGYLLGWRTVCAVEIEPYPASVLVARQNEGFLPPFPIWDNVCTFEGRPWRGRVDVVSGGFPCQDISSAGKGVGIDGARSGLWREMARIIREVEPRYVFVENSPMLTSRGLERVLGDLAEMGFDAQWGVLGASDARYQHGRKRLWVVANSDQAQRHERGKQGTTLSELLALSRTPRRRPAESPVCRRSDGVAARVDRLSAIGNGQVPAVAHLAWKVLSDEL